MENRFGVKDLFLFALLLVLIVVIFLAMKQFDRQYDQVLLVKDQNKGLERDLIRLRNEIRGIGESVDEIKSRPGVPGTPTTGPTTGPAIPPPSVAKIDAFTHVKAAEKMPGFARGDWLVDNTATKIGKLTPFISTDVYQTWVESQVLEGMVVRDPYTLEYVPRVASRWEISPDGLKMKFFLRKGVEFSDGEPLDADDVLFTFNLVRNPAINADRDRSYLTKLKDVRKIDQHTVEFEFTEFYYLNFSVVGAASIMPEHFYSKFTPEQYNERTGLLMGSGPYRLENPENWSPGKPVILFRNERYWGTPGTFERIVFNEIEGEAVEMFRYGNQEHDLIRCTPEQYRNLTADTRVMAFSNAMEFDNVYSGFSYCAWNQLKKENGKETPTRFADKRLRQAMTLLLDRERIARDIFMGYATVSSGPFSPKSKQSKPDVKPWAFDESRAKTMLKDLGYADRNNDGVLEDAGGTPFKFKLVYPSGNETLDKIVLFMKDSYGRAGIVLEPDKVDWPVLIKKLNESDFDAITLAFSGVPESDPYQIFHSSQIAGQGDNRTNYINKELDVLIEKARVTVDVDARMKLWQQVHAILHEDQPYTFMFHRKALRLFNKRIKNIEPAPIGLNFDYLNGGLMPWFVPKEQQKYTK